MNKIQGLFIALICTTITIVNTNVSSANNIGIVNLSGVTSAYCYIYNTSGDYISKQYVNSNFELPVASYVFSVNGTVKKVNVKAGKNKFPLGNMNLSAVTNAYCYVYSSSDTSCDYLSRHYSSNLFDLFPGTYTFAVNGTIKEVKVEAGKNEFPLGNINLSAVTNAYCYVYSSSDTSDDYLSRHYSSNLFDLFPGTYTFAVNGTTKEVNVEAGKKGISIRKHKLVSCDKCLLLCL